MPEKELRVISLPLDAPLELREHDDGTPPTITGYTAIYNDEVEINSFFGKFREVIRPGFFTRAINERQDVRALYNHDSNFLLGRTSSGTLNLKEDSKGLFVEISPPDTQSARDLITSIKRRDVTGMSFAFTIKKLRWTENRDEDEEGDDEETDLRELLEINTLFDVGPVVYPVYESTTAETKAFRSMDDIFKEGKEMIENTDLVVRQNTEGQHYTTAPNGSKYLYTFPSAEAAGIADWRIKPATITPPITLKIDLPIIGKILATKGKTTAKKQARARELELLELEASN